MIVITNIFCGTYLGHNFSSPSNLQVDRVNSSSFRVTWSVPSVRLNASIRIDGYHIEVFDHQENGTIYRHTYPYSQQCHEQGSLHPSYQYQIEVSAIVADIQGPIATHSVKTSEDSKSCNDEMLTTGYIVKIFAGQKVHPTHLVATLALWNPCSKNCHMLYVIINFNRIGQKSLQDKKVSSMRAMGEKVKISPDKNFWLLIYYYGIMVAK